MIKKFLGKIFSKERIIWFVLLAAAVCAAVFFINRYNSYEGKWKTAVENNKAYSLQLDKEKAQSNMFKLKTEQLEYYNDSIIGKLNNAKKELKVKDNQLKQLMWLESEFQKKDTVRLVDTIFKETDFVMDTLIGDEWVKTSLHMEYPGTITTESSVKSEKAVVVSAQRETVDPPKKFFLCRWFQKKHTVIKVVVKENNPHIIDQENVFIEIVD